MASGHFEKRSQRIGLCVRRHIDRRKSHSNSSSLRQNVSTHEIHWRKLFGMICFDIYNENYSNSYSGYDLRVRLGEWDVNHDVEFFPYIERDVVSVHVHPEYYAGTLDNDLAILKLSVPVEFQNNPHISPACLPDRHTDFTGQRCWTTGWGKRSH